MTSKGISQLKLSGRLRRSVRGASYVVRTRTTDHSTRTETAYYRPSSTRRRNGQTLMLPCARRRHSARALNDLLISWSVTYSSVISLLFLVVCCLTWRCGATGLTSDLRSRGRGFDSRSGRSCVPTMGKLFTPLCPCHQAL